MPFPSNGRLFWLHYSGFRALGRDRQQGIHVSLLLLFKNMESKQYLGTNMKADCADFQEVAFNVL
jgi:hypothetical protein